VAMAPSSRRTLGTSSKHVDGFAALYARAARDLQGREQRSLAAVGKVPRCGRDDDFAEQAHIVNCSDYFDTAPSGAPDRSQLHRWRVGTDGSQASC
jgi:hypothetical protein